jgi:predicted CXXCH cytochrome family protein
MQQRPTHPSIAERCDIDVPQRPESPLRRWRRLVTWLMAPLALLFLGSFEVRRDHKVYRAGPLSTLHENAKTQAGTLLKNDCRACHSQLGQPALRVLTGNDAVRSVQDKDCRACHEKRQTHDHNALMITGNVRDCVMCHREHRGKSQLSQVAVALCAECHTDLKTTTGVNNFARHTPSWEEHAEFAVFRPISPGHPNLEQPGPDHLVHQLAEYINGQWRDRAHLRFNHRLHLPPEGILTPWDYKHEKEEGSAAAKVGSYRKLLTCGSCHVTDEGGVYMKPIDFERHCQDCHPLSFSQQLDGPLPHGSPLQFVLEYAGGRLRDDQRKFPAGVSDEESDVPRLPNKPPAAAAAAARAAAEMNVLHSVKQGCGRCHVTPEPAGEADEFKLPKLPNRWMPHSRFRHDKHHEYACIICHNPDHLNSSGELVMATNAASVKERTLNSADTADILMPPIEVCHKCHGTKTVARRWPVEARSDCIECHYYHPKEFKPF